MSNSKKLATPHPKRSQKATAASSSTAKAFKSAELIVDSDEDEDPAENTSAVDLAVPTKSKSASLSIGKEKASFGLQSLSTKPSKRPKPLTPSTSDGDSNSHSLNEPTSDTKSPALSGRLNVPQKPPVGAPTSTIRPSLKRKSPSASASVIESSEDEVEPDRSPMPHKRPRTSPKAQPISKRADSTPSKQQTRGLESSDASQSGSEEESETESENGSQGESSQSRSNEETPIATSKKSIPQPSLLPYAPPLGFEPATTSSHASASHTGLFSPSNLQGKQIWHIAIPRSVPVTSITSVAKKSVQDGSAITSHKGANYCFIPELENQTKNTVLLLPSDEDDRYKPANTGIMQTLHLQQLVTLPSIAHDVGAQDAGTQVGGTITLRKSIEKPAPEQPEGLRMRYKPIGVEDSDDPDANLRPTKVQKAPEFRVPTLSASSKSPKKRKHNETIDPHTDDDTSPTKRSAKSKSAAKPNDSRLGMQKDAQAAQEIGTNASTKGSNQEMAESNPAGKASGRIGAQEDARLIRENGTSSSSVNESSKKKKHRIDHSTPKDTLSSRHVNTNGNVAKPSPSEKDKFANPSNETQSSSPKKKRRKHKTIPAVDESPHEITSADRTTVSNELRMPTPVASKHDIEPRLANGTSTESTAKKQEIDSGKLSKKSKIPGETVEERRKRRAEKKRRKEAAEASTT
ncbi:hypothetical protein G7Y79_00016g040970 [Physcia stellaris]|nr:hypothetical protein G7Y79_00016g040970 [Physcia stellaris]